MAQYKGPAKESQRVMHLQKKREREQEELELRKTKMCKGSWPKRTLEREKPQVIPTFRIKLFQALTS